MGCKLSKIFGSGSKTDENSSGADNVLAEPPSPRPPDPRLPLTAKQKYHMIASWKGINRTMEQTGVLMFIKLFEEHKELINLFDKFKKLKTKEEQVGSAELVQHATTVMKTLDDSIKSLDNMDAFFEYVYQVGSFHKRIPGFKSEYFLKIEKPFLAAAKTILDDRYTENVENIYKITIKFILQTLIDGFEKSSTEPIVDLAATSTSNTSNNNSVEKADSVNEST